jgi:hypothetical protein
MEPLPANSTLTFEVTFGQPGLPVAMTIYDTLTGTPVLVDGPLAMTNVPGTGTYIGNFTAEPETTYLVIKSVYTDGTFETLDTDYTAGSETFTTVSGNSSVGSGCLVVGYVEPSDTVVGVVIDNPVIGFVEC